MCVLHYSIHVFNLAFLSVGLIGTGIEMLVKFVGLISHALEICVQIKFAVILVVRMRSIEKRISTI